MSRRQASKRTRANQGSYLPPFARLEPYEQLRTGWTYRGVMEESEQRLANSTRGIRSAFAHRVLGGFTMSLAYPGNIEKLESRSRLRELPSLADIAKQIESLELASLHEPVTATIVGVRKFNNAIGAIVTYPSLKEEVSIINNTVREAFDLPFPVSVAPGEAHVSLVKGIGGTTAEHNRIKSALPATVELSAAHTVK